MLCVHSCCGCYPFRGGERLRHAVVLVLNNKTPGLITKKDASSWLPEKIRRIGFLCRRERSENKNGALSPPVPPPSGPSVPPCLTKASVLERAGVRYSGTREPRQPTRAQSGSRCIPGEAGESAHAKIGLGFAGAGALRGHQWVSVSYSGVSGRTADCGVGICKCAQSGKGVAQRPWGESRPGGCGGRQHLASHRALGVRLDRQGRVFVQCPRVLPQLRVTLRKGAASRGCGFSRLGDIGLADLVAQQELLANSSRATLGGNAFVINGKPGEKLRLCPQGRDVVQDKQVPRSRPHDAVYEGILVHVRCKARHALRARANEDENGQNERRAQSRVTAMHAQAGAKWLWRRRHAPRVQRRRGEHCTPSPARCRRPSLPCIGRRGSYLGA